MKGFLEQTLYHSFLKVAACVLAFVLVFDSGLLFSGTAEISNLAQQHVANVVGVSVGVAPNEVNQLTARITELETELETKERLIAVDVRQKESVGGIDTSTFILSIILFILLVLIVLNYVLDFLRMRKAVSTYEIISSEVA